ncbi:hypothetical protein FRC07_006594 [Ceratobasidium sp. 392]|nr:hypothetical protein FRC07_006594 [Ceratobasidium sp. 392]
MVDTAYGQVVVSNLPSLGLDLFAPVMRARRTRTANNDDMGTRGLKAYLYKNRFGDWFAAQVPREEEARQAEQIEQELVWRHQHDIEDGEDLEADCVWDDDGGFATIYEGREMLFQDVRDNKGGMVPTGDLDSTEWSYVIDLDSRAFTINGLMHFRLDNMPPGSLNSYFWRIPTPKSPGKSCIPTFAHPPSTPIEYIATVSRWPPPKFDTTQIHEKYEKLSLALLSIEEWGAPTWNTLTVAQKLSANLVQTILLDSADSLSNPDVRRMRASFGVCCWQLISAAAPSHLCCPSEVPPSKASHSISRRDPLTRSLRDLKSQSTYARSSCITPHYGSWVTTNDQSLDCKYYWFRGCLVVFCPRLEGAEYVEHQTLLMVETLRNHGRTNGIGIIFSGRHILAVAVDGDTVRCSHPLLFHDTKMNSQDGFLLATHLLSPLLTVNKTPWIPSLCSELLAGSAGRLPDEIIQQIAFHLDHDSYRNLGYVSRFFREVYTQYPRVGNYILQGYTGNGNYRVLWTATGTVRTLHLQRDAPFNKRHISLVHTFQHISYGPHNLYQGSDDNICIIGTAEPKSEGIISPGVKRVGNRWSPVRLQAVHGIWSFVDPKEAASNFPGEMEYDEERDSHPGYSTWSDYRW